jgi:hypothetical protein
MDVVRQCESTETLAGRAIRCRAPQDWVKLASTMTLDVSIDADEMATEAALQTIKV